MVPELSSTVPSGLRVSELGRDSEPLVVLSYRHGPDLSLGALTECEAAVVLLALRGLSNKEIAQIRAVSVRTVANQLAAAYRKLGGVTRGSLCSHAAERDLESKPS